MKRPLIPLSSLHCNSLLPAYHACMQVCQAGLDAGWINKTSASMRDSCLRNCHLLCMMQQPLPNERSAMLKTVSAVLLHCLPLEALAPLGTCTNGHLFSYREYLEIIVMQCPPERPVYLLGESFGGVMALAVAEARPDLVRPTHEQLRILVLLIYTETNRSFRCA